MTAAHSYRLIDVQPWLANVDPRLKLAWLATVSLACIYLQDAYALAALCACAALPYVAIRLTWRSTVTYLGLLILVTWTIIYSQAVFYFDKTADPWFTILPPWQFAGYSFEGLHFYREGALYGAVQSMRFAANLLAGGSVALTTSPERLLAALIRLRIPTSLSYMATAALRSLPVSLEEWAALRQAYRLRTGKKPASWRLLEPLLASTLRRASTLALAVRARGFDPGAPRAHSPPLRFRLHERLARAGLGVLWIVAVGEVFVRYLT